jgi:hypothetical protein
MPSAWLRSCSPGARGSVEVHDGPAGITRVAGAQHPAIAVYVDLAQLMTTAAARQRRMSGMAAGQGP